MTDVTASPLGDALRDRYSIERELGRGGMAMVYLAHDIKHDRKVALKVLPPELATAVGLERFHREIRTTARLQHLHILPVLDSGEAAHQLWYTMPYIDGESLRERLRRERQLAIDEALQITRELADALGYAHSQGVFHRDVKPENILLRRGHALLADFGVAHALHAAGADKLTATGMSVGTPAYMSPEQALADSGLDGRSDLYSLGCVLYEMLAGEAPYTGASAQAILGKRLSEPVPHVRSVRDTVPPHVAQALERVLAKTPADRFPTAESLADALATPIRLAANPSPAGSSSSRPVLWKALAALGLVLLVGITAVLYSRRAIWVNAPTATSGRATRVAVLPFENLGDTGDAYFAEGMTDAVRDMLTRVPGVEVVASASSRQYRHTAKVPAQIGKELQTPYILLGSVRWVKRRGVPDRVQLRPELIDTRSGAERWGEPIEADLTDVFKIQTEIATRVTESLGRELGTAQEQVQRSSGNPLAYDAFLRGRAARLRSQNNDRKALEEARTALERAVTLDSNFAVAWADLARVLALLYSPTGVALTDPVIADASLRAAQRAVQLAPGMPDAHIALAEYYERVADEPLRTLQEDSIALALAPGDADRIAAVGVDELYLGRWSAARRHLEQAAALDPLSTGGAGGSLGTLLLLTRDYPAAQRVLDAQVQIARSSLGLREMRAMVSLAQADLGGAQAVLRQAPPEAAFSALVYFATFNDLYWMLTDDQQQQVLGLGPSGFNGDSANFALVAAEILTLRKESARARMFANTAAAKYEAQVERAPQEPWLHAAHGLALAYSGRPSEAIREGQRASALQPYTHQTQGWAYMRHQLVRIYLLVGERERAMEALDSLLKVPYYLSPGWLRIDPTFDPLRGDPRFERLVAGS